jgi:predicted GTPase
MVEKVIIMGAAGRDFHNFNVYFRDNPRYQVVAFTAAQIPRIEGRLYPKELCGKLYPDGIPIHSEAELADLIRKNKVDLVAFSYSDVPHVEVMHKASIAMAEGADFILIGATYTMLRSRKPVVAICAVRTGCGKSQTTRKVCDRTGCGKSQTTRKVCDITRKLKKKVVVVRHPMPYGDLRAQVVQRFSSYDDFEKHQCTIEEREEYEPLVDQGIVVYAGVDYGKILEAAEKEADIIVWDGGNNDTPFYYPDLHIVLFDPHREGHESLYYPGETNMIMAHIAIINKVDTAPSANVERVRKNIRQYAPDAEIVLAESPVLVNPPERIKGKRAEIVNPRPYAVGTIGETYRLFPHMGPVLPAMGYSDEQIGDLEGTINNADCDLVLFATPIQLTRILSINKPALRVRYEYRDHGHPLLEDIIISRLEALKT